ncbi:IucA/IucC family protein [Pseudogulbenkiania subflava]|uniref:Siderophore synthetase component n=1 Tax=Pseudogulbenkiania subflava DSM 22618 TaxID=1123014 RepID=A0A1Y6BLZ8_9NEIS|nr:IucA/IucC family protein [Pseudogulbenkiania subflava]SMF10218.1 Siderophore synthetase component [Pseudogulbenkiania subflava DSM 22618]
MTALLSSSPLSRQGVDYDADYVCTRVIDTLLREDVRDCASRGELLSGDALPAGLTENGEGGRYWLRVAHLGSAALWIPVVPTRYMQSWRLARLPLLREDSTSCTPLYDIDAVLSAFADGLPPEAARLFTDYAIECRTALEHRRTAKAERARWFDEADALPGHSLPRWEQRLLHHDRLAAFLDHPYYPSARAKLGFEPGDLARYAPEFQPSFELNWLAVPRTLYHPSGTALPPGWPNFEDVGLPAGLAAEHALVPVHPFVWRHHLDGFLAEAGLAGQVIRAPRSHLTVTPTLSVRSLVLHDTPDWHVKLPLTIRTLGAKNIRTIKPSTITDGHRIQTLLGAIVARETSLHGQVLLTNEENGAHVAQRPFLGFILRRYPEQALANATAVPIAGLLADAPHGGSVVEELAARYYDGDLDAWLDAYMELTLRLHLTLWLRYGIALESNQQNSVLVYGDDGLRLLLKDNDAARIDTGLLARRWPQLADKLAGLVDARIAVSDELPLAQMFTTITLQLNIAALIEGIAERRGIDPAASYARVRYQVEAVLEQLAAEGENVAFARQTLLEDDTLYLKYLLRAASLEEKSQTGVADVNKFYGKRAPNFLKAVR